MITFQDFEEQRRQGEEYAILNAINDWKNGAIYRTAKLADTYDKQLNDTIMTYVQKIFSLSGTPVEDFTASNNKIASNFFRRLNVQRNTYSLGNGVTFETDGIKEKFGAKFDTALLKLAYNALIHGVSFAFWNGEVNCLKATEFVPLWDEESGVLRAGIRFWQIDEKKPMFMVVYEQDGYTKWKKDKDGFRIVEEKKPYIEKVVITEADGVEIIDGENYSVLPIVALWGSELHQSTLVGLRSQIDSYDLIRSGFANDLSDVSQIYWIIENYGGMSEGDLAQFRDRLKLNHIASADTSEGGKITPYSQDIPFQARQTYLDGIEKSIYRDFGALDVHEVSASSTNDHLEAAYQPLDENADDFEAQIIEFVQMLGELIGLNRDDCIPLFKRNRIANNSERMQMLAMADWLDTETKIRHTPFITVDEQESVLKRTSVEEVERFIPKKETSEE